MITITGEPKEIAALVAELQGRRNAVNVEFKGTLADITESCGFLGDRTKQL